MISLNDVLLAMSNIPVDDPIAEIWGRGLQGGDKIIEYTGSLPITINADGNTLLDYRIYGVSGGVGERTENLIDVSQIEKIGSLYQSGKYALVCDKNTTYTFSSSKTMQSIYVYGTSDYSSDRIAVSYATTSVSFGTGARSTVYLRFDLNNTSDDYRTADLMLVEGSTAPTSYIPYGYKLPMTVMNNLAPPLSQWIDGYITVSGNITSASAIRREKTSDFIEVKPNTQYVFGIEGGAFPQGTTDGAWAAVCSYRDDRTSIQRYSSNKRVPYNFLTTPETKYVRLSYRSYGELWEPRFSESSFSTPVYIGENQLDAGEYVSYGEQKIYRDVDGTLTPTDPPVPLPEIPTIDGTTIIDYDGDPKPSQMYIKYKGKG